MSHRHQNLICQNKFLINLKKLKTLATWKGTLKNNDAVTNFPWRTGRINQNLDLKIVKREKIVFQIHDKTNTIKVKKGILLIYFLLYCFFYHPTLHIFN